MNNKKLINVLPYIVVAVVLVLMLTYGNQSNTNKFDYNTFAAQVEKLDITEADISMGNTVISVAGKYNENGTPRPFTVSVPNTNENVKWLQENLNKGTRTITISDPYKDNFLMTLFWNLMPLVLFGGFAFFMFSKMNSGGNNKAFEFSKSRAKIEGNIRVRFDDVAGCDEEKEEVKEIIDYLKNPKKFTDMGARIPKGMLMVGPPGTGKTLLAKAVAGEADVPFFSISGSDFVEMFVGTGASRVRDMFKKAQQTAPCIVFIDEIDAVGRQRGAGMGGGNDEREQTLNQLLVEMDGMSENIGIVIIAATNRPDVLDPALLRSGRFDRQITVNLPDKKGRTAILEVHSKGKKLASDVSLENLAKRTPGFSGADLENVLNEGAILAVREERNLVTMDDLDEAIDRVMMGPAKKSKKYTEKEKRLVAFHEAGHAVIGLKLEDSDMVQKVTIIPRGDAGGYNLMTPREEKMMPTKADFLAQITGLLGGRVAEEVIFNEISAGASNDIQRVTKIAKMMVKSFGMSKLGPVQYDDNSGNVFLGRDYGKGNDYSGEIAFEIDKEIREIVGECHKQCTAIIKENLELLHLIANTLIEEETITNEQIMNLVDHGTIYPIGGKPEPVEPVARVVEPADAEVADEHVPEAIIENAAGEEVKPVRKPRAKKEPVEKPSFEEAMKEVIGEGEATTPKKRGRKKKIETEGETPTVESTEVKKEEAVDASFEETNKDEK